jgi:hypothetical protein
MRWPERQAAYDKEFGLTLKVMEPRERFHTRKEHYG